MIDVFGLAYGRTRRILVSIVMHLLWNILAVAALGAAMPANPYETATSSQTSRFRQIHVPLSAGTKAYISQGAFGETSHSESGNEYSWDFDVPYGTSVIAADSGTVIDVWEPAGGTGCNPKFSNTAHNIKIRHTDGTIAQYVHVQAEVKSGQRVAQGQRIAVTAENGWICRPQLHFGVYRSEKDLYNSPTRQTIPIYFLGLPNGLLREGDTIVVPAYLH